MLNIKQREKARQPISQVTEIKEQFFIFGL